MTAPAARPPRSRVVATWLALVAGTLGAHRFYLHGARDLLAWLHVPPTLVGVYGWWRMRHFGVDDALGSVLVLCLGAAVAAATLQTIVYGLTSEERWATRQGAPAAPAPTQRSAWPTVIAVVLAVAIGAGATMATIALAAQRYFESSAVR